MKDRSKFKDRQYSKAVDQTQSYLLLESLRKALMEEKPRKK